MPHCLIDYSKGLENQVPTADILHTVQQTVAASPLFEPINVRSRALAFEDFRLGADKSHFLHVSLKILPGRTDEQKTQLTQQVIDALQQLPLSDVLLSCECLEIHDISYQRASL